MAKARKYSQIQRTAHVNQCYKRDQKVGSNVKYKRVDRELAKAILDFDRRGYTPDKISTVLNVNEAVAASFVKNGINANVDVENIADKEFYNEKGLIIR